MRQIGIVQTKELARRFEDYLLTLGITGVVRDQGAACAIWIHDEDAVTRAETELRSFVAQPDDPKYAASDAQTIRKKQEEAERGWQERAVEMPDAWRGPRSLMDIPVSMGLIVLSVMVAAFTQVGEDHVALRHLLLTPAAFGQGELWRLVTPIFVHYGFLHLLCNMLWVKDLGGMIEMIKGRFYLVILVLAIAIPSNLAQFFVTGPGCGGMSGVVFGLFGYIWVKAKREPWSGFHIEQYSVVLMLGWFVLCAANVVGPIGNVCHGVGLAVGTAIGFIPGKAAAKR